MVQRLKALVLALALLPLPASAGPKAVVELFTSQGCSSCPPADALLVDLAKRPDVIALTLPVDYWDYLGWKDTFAQPAFTKRQRAYAHTRGDRQVFTPQMVVNGAKSVVGSDRKAVEEAMKDGAFPAEISLAEENGQVTATVRGTTERAVVWLMSVSKLETVTVGRGENQGRTIAYANVVRSLTRLGEWTGGETRFGAPLEAARAVGDGYVVLVQEAHGFGGKPGVIIGAAKSPGW